MLLPAKMTVYDAAQKALGSIEDHGRNRILAFSADGSPLGTFADRAAAIEAVEAAAANAVAPEERPIAGIRIGKRHRKNAGDLASLAASIGELGLLHPIPIKPDGELIAGERRLRACEALGWTRVPVHVVNIDNIARGELAENVERVPFLPSEIEAIRRTLEPIEKAAAESRMKAGTPAKVSQGSGRATDKIGAFAGISGRTVEKIAAVVAAAEADPERFGQLAEQMDASGKVDRAHKQLKIARAREAYEARREQGGRVSDLGALAESGFRAGVVYADPAWPWETWGGESGKIQTAPDNHYKTMTLAEIEAFGAKYVLPLAADDCLLLMWTTWPLLALGADIADIIRAWGFEPKTLGFIWVKTNLNGEGLHWGNGYYTRANSEPCVLATRGSPLRLAADVHQVVMAPVGEHSAKPDEVHDRIERLVAGPYLELFARRERPGWTTWGDEVPPPLPASSSGDVELRYVPHADVAGFESEGWQRTAALDGTHHGHHAVLMQRPAQDEAAGGGHVARRR